jgi:chromosome segregation ATPase
MAAKETKDVTLDDAVAALGQMSNFFKAFRRAEELVEFMRTGEQRKKELDAQIKALEEARGQNVDLVTAENKKLNAELDEVNGKAKAARARLAKVEADEKKAIEEAERTAAALAEIAKKQMQDIAEAQAEAEAKLTATREAEAEAQARLDEIKVKIAGIAAASAV